MFWLSFWSDQLLGHHIYYNAMFSLENFDEGADYVIFDDYDAAKFPSYKCWFGAQEEFTLTDKYAKKRTVKWGKPMIWLSNDNPLNNPIFDPNWLQMNCIVYNLEDKLYGEPPMAPFWDVDENTVYLEDVPFNNR